MTAMEKWAQDVDAQQLFSALLRLLPVGAPQYPSSPDIPMLQIPKPASSSTSLSSFSRKSMRPTKPTINLCEFFTRAVRPTLPRGNAQDSPLPERDGQEQVWHLPIPFADSPRRRRETGRRSAFWHQAGMHT